MDDSLFGRSLVKEADLTPLQYCGLVALAAELKAAKRTGAERPRLRGRNIALIFEKPSTRTRCSFEVAAHDQGANVTYLDPLVSHIGERESIEDTARVLGRLYDGIEFRGRSQQSVETLARYAGVPVWNGLTDLWHPTQVVADMLTVSEHSAKPWQDITLAYLGDGESNIANSLRIGGALLGMTVRVVRPNALRGDPAIVSAAEVVAAGTGGVVVETDDIDEGVRGVDFLYTDVWVRIGESVDEWRERVQLLRPYRVDSDTMAQTKNPAVKFMHCLPALHDPASRLGAKLLQETGLDSGEVTDEVFRSAASVVFDQAENRMHTVKAILVATLSVEPGRGRTPYSARRRAAPSRLERDGFARYSAEDFRLGLSETMPTEGLRPIAEAFKRLPPDPYAPRANRFRRYSRAVYLPWTQELTWIPGVPDDVHGLAAEFNQGGYNTEYENVRRLLPEIPTELRDDSLLLRLIRFDLDQALWLEELGKNPVHVGVHTVKLSVSDPADTAISSPNCLHQDGGAFTFTFAHLVGRSNAVGGENVIASPSCAGLLPENLSATVVKARFTLVEPLDTYAVHDPRVSHYISPVRCGDGQGPGERCVLLVGLAPLIVQP